MAGGDVCSYFQLVVSSQ